MVIVTERAEKKSLKRNMPNCHSVNL